MKSRVDFLGGLVVGAVADGEGEDVRLAGFADLLGGGVACGLLGEQIADGAATREGERADREDGGEDGYLQAREGVGHGGACRDGEGCAVGGTKGAVLPLGFCLKLSEGPARHPADPVPANDERDTP